MPTGTVQTELNVLQRKSFKPRARHNVGKTFPDQNRFQMQKVTCRITTNRSQQLPLTLLVLTSQSQRY